MKTKQVLEDLDRDHLREQLGLNPDEVIPEILPCKLVVAAKPEFAAPPVVPGDATKSDQTEQPWKAKIRLCACGNFEESHGNEDNTTSNVSPIALRLMAHELAKHKSWIGANGDVSMAFLNTELDPTDIVLLAGLEETWLSSTSHHLACTKIHLWIAEITKEMGTPTRQHHARQVLKV